MPSPLPAEVITENPPAVLVFVAIHTEVLPIGPVSRIIKAVAVFVVDCKKMTVFEIKFPPAFGADKSVNLQ